MIFTFLKDARKYLKENFDDGSDCPCCGQFVKKYRYNLFATSAVALIDLYKLTKKYGHNFYHVKEFAEARQGKARASHFAELRYWRLVIPMNSKTAITNSSGMWQITNEGIKFVRNQYYVPKCVLVFNNKFRGFEGEKIDIREALGNKFNYSELMGNQGIEELEGI